MVFTATITSQGQITLPAKARKQLGFNPSRKLIITINKNEMILKTEPDLIELSGSLNNVAIKNKSIKQIMDLENKAIKKARLEKYSNIIK